MEVKRNFGQNLNDMSPPRRPAGLMMETQGALETCGMFLIKSYQTCEVCHS
jgi:hypothetical protein